MTDQFGPTPVWIPKQDRDRETDDPESEMRRPIIRLVSAGLPSVAARGRNEGETPLNIRGLLANSPPMGQDRLAAAAVGRIPLLSGGRCDARSHGGAYFLYLAVASAIAFLGAVPLAAPQDSWKRDGPSVQRQRGRLRERGDPLLLDARTGGPGGWHGFGARRGACPVRDPAGPGDRAGADRMWNALRARLAVAGLDLALLRHGGDERCRCTRCSRN